MSTMPTISNRTSRRLPAISCGGRGLAGAGWFVLALCVGASVAHAQTKVVVGEVTGRGGAQVRAAVVRALQEHDEVVLVSNNAVSSTESRLGVEAKGNGRYDVSRALGVAAWIEGDVDRAGRSYSVTLVVIDGGSGQTLTVMSYEAKQTRALARLTQDALWGDLGPLIQSAHAPPAMVQARAPVNAPPAAQRQPARAAEQEPANDEEEEGQEEEQEPESEPSEGDDDRPSPLDVSAGLIGMSRDFSYKDDLSGLSKYHLDLGPSLALQAHWYPVAHFQGGVPANIGLDLRGRFMFAVDSGLDGESYPTSARALGIGLRGRLPLGEHELAAVVGYASQTYKIDSADTDAGKLDPGIPSASYGLLRLGLEGRLVFGDVRVGLAAAFLPVLGTGELGKWFPHASQKGIEAEASLGYALSRAFELSAAVGFQRIAFSMNPKLGDVDEGRPIAGGAVDQTLMGTLGARFWLGR